MSRPPQSLRAIADGLRTRHALLRSRSIPLKERADPALLAVLAAAVLALGAGGWTLARIEDARGFLDPPAVEEIDDPRILTDYRDAEAPIVDMVPQGFEAFAGRSDGTIHRYDMRTGLISEERLPGTPTLAGPLSFLSSTCTEGADCPPGATVFAVTETGGLAARSGGDWRTVISDSAWMGADGAPIDLPDVRLWALSDDGRWLLASAGEQGLGLFDQTRSVWVPVAQAGVVSDPAHLNFAFGRFWLGGTEGLESVDTHRPSERMPVPSIGAVLDLERTAEGNLLVLHSGACPGGTCLSISEVRSPTDLRRLVGETTISPGLSSASLSHAALQGTQAVVLGAAGVHVYDPQSRSWTAIETGSVDAFHAGPEGRFILYAAGSNVGRVSGGRLAWRGETPDKVAQILPGPADSVLALLRNGSVVDLARPVPEVIAPADIGPGDPAQILTAATVNGTVVLRRGGDLILHDPAARRWSIAPGTVPPAAGQDARLLGTGRALWLVDLRQGRVWEGAIGGVWPSLTVDFRNASPALGRLVSAEADGGDLHLVDADGYPLRLRVGGGLPEVRVGAPAASGFRPVTGAAEAGTMVFSDGQVIAAYYTAQRHWDEAFQGPPGGVRDLDFAPDTLLALARTGVLYGVQDDAWATVSGAPGGIALGSDQLTDAIQAGSSIFLGGAGRVVEYRADTRRSTRAFGGGAGEVRLAGVSNGEPVWTSGGRLYQGVRQISETGERVVWAGRGPGGFLYTAEENGRLHAVLPAQPRQCLFRGFPAPGGNPVDARGLPDGRVFVATTGGLAIHEPRNRRWVRLAGAGVSAGARIEIVADHLVLLDGATARAVPLGALPTPDSCDTGVAQIDWAALPEALQVVHDAVGDRLLLLARDGGVQEWRGVLRRLLPPAGSMPTMSSLRRVRAVPEGLVFAAADRVWAYDRQNRTWASRPVEGGPSSVGTIDLDTDGGMIRMTVWDSAGQGFGGEAVTGAIPLRPLTLPVMPRPQQDTARIRDMAQDDRVVAILGDRMLELFDQNDLSQRTGIRLPEARQGWTLAQVEGARGLVLTDGPLSAPERMFVLGLDAARREGTADLAAVSFAYAPADDRDWQLSDDALWRIDQNLILHRCDLSDGGAAPAGCIALTRSPALLPPNNLIAAATFPGGDRLALVEGAVLRVGSDRRVEGRWSIPGATNGSLLFREGPDVFLWTGQGGDVWRFAETQEPEMLLDRVLDLRLQSSGLAATRPDGLQIIRVGGAPERPRAGDLTLRAATGDAGGVVHGLGPDGLLRRQGQSADPVSDAAIPENVLAVAQGPVPDGAELASPGAIWAQHADGQVRVHWVGLCRPPDPEPEPEPGVERPARPAPAMAEPPEVPRDGPDVGAPDGRSAEQDSQVPSSPSRSAPDENPAPPDSPQDPSAPSEEETIAGAAPELEPEPLTNPEPLPCAQVLNTGLSLAADERMLQVREDGAGATVLSTLATYRFTAAMLFEGRQSDWTPEVVNDTNALSAIRDMIVDVDGRPFLSPPSLRGSGGRFEVDRGAGSPQFHTGGKIRQAAQFDLSWLSWDRTSQAVRFADGSILPPPVAIRDGRFLPDIPGRAAYLGGEDFALLNSHGLWQVRIGREVRPVRIAPSDLPVDVAGGRFLFTRGGVDARSGAAVTDAGQEAVILGALRVTETLRGGRLEATYSVDGRDVPALSAQGFAFDQREGITAQEGVPLLLTPLGLLPASGFGAGIAPPTGATAVDAEGSVVLARGPGGWSRRTAQGWTASAPPWHDRLLAEGDGRRWERKSGVFGIAAATPADVHAVARQGLDFEADRLQALAADARGIVAITGTGTAEAGDLAALSVLGPPVAPDPGARSLDARDAVPGRTILWADTAQGPKVWGRATRAWRSAGQGEDPWTFRVAVNNGDLRFAFRQGRPEPSVQIEDLGGAPRIASFGWSAGQDMPFDRVRGFAVQGDRILLATELGLRRLVWSGNSWAARGLYSGVGVGDAPLAFDRVGRPSSDPSRLLATAGNSCLELASPDAAPVPCAVRISLAERAISSDPVWEWRKTDTDILGTYRDRSGQPLAAARLGPEGHWPHDRLRGAAQCSGATVELWADADVVARAGSGLPEGLQFLPGVQAFLCQATAAELGQGGRLGSGFLAAGVGNGWRLSAQGWQREGHAAAILDRAAGGVPWESGRLRLRIDGARAVQEIRGLDDVWRIVPWDGDRPAIDQVVGIAGSGETLRLLTPSGVLDWSFARRRLDPDTLILRTPDDRGALSNCRPERIEARDGSVQAAPRLQGDPVEILCEDGRVWRGDPSAGTDAGVFAPVLSDIGTDRVLVQEGDWRFERLVTARGAMSLSIEFRDEAVSLDAGRLSLDDYAGLAAPYADHVEIVTQGLGWWRNPRHDLSLTAARRPPSGTGAETVTALHTDAVDGAPSLCVQGPDAVIFDRSGTVARAPECRDVRGADATYTWHSGPGGAAADGVALNGLPIRRDLVGGRFDDLFVTGGPLPGEQGRIIAPTRAGVVVIGPSGPEGTFAKSDPTFLSPDPAGQPIALGTVGVMPLRGADQPACRALVDLSARLPAVARVLRVHPVAPDAVEVLVAEGDGNRLPLLIPCGSVQDALAWSLPLNVSERGRYRAFGADVLSPRVLVSRDGSRLAVADPAGRGVALEAMFLGPRVAQVAAPDSRAVVMATERALYRMDTDQVLSRIANEGRSDIPAPSGPFAPRDLPATKTIQTPTPSGPAPTPPSPWVRPATPSPVAPAVRPPALASGSSTQPDQAPPGSRPASAPPSPDASAPVAPAEPPQAIAPSAVVPPVADDTVPLELSGDEWRQVQEALRNLGLYTGAIDGIAGPRTRAALRAWQARTGRPETGVLTEHQKAELLSVDM